MNTPWHTRCKHCGQWINPAFGAVAPAEHSDTKGTLEDPHAPGDYDDVCAPCGYGDPRTIDPLTERDSNT